MNRRDALAGFAALVAARTLPAQVPARPPRVAFLFFGAPPPEGIGAEPIVRRLAAYGWVDRGKASFVARWARGDATAYAGLAGELAALAPDVCCAIGSDIAQTLVHAAPAVPVVFAVSDDPVANGMVASLARPGARATGVVFMSPELAGKRLEILREIAPGIRRVAVLTDSRHRALYLPPLERAAAALGLALTTSTFESPADFDAAFARAAGAEGVFVVPSRYSLAYAGRMAEIAAARRLPAISAYDAFARAGGLVSYGPTVDEVLARLATQIDRVLRGARPEDTPVEQPTRIALIVNRRTAATIGLAIPPALLARADEVIG